MQQNAIGDQDTDTHQPDSSANSQHQWQNVEFPRCTANVYYKSQAERFVKHPVLCIAHFKLIRESKIKSGRSARLLKWHVEPSKCVFRVAALIKVVITIPNYID